MGTGPYVNVRPGSTRALQEHWHRPSICTWARAPGVRMPVTSAPSAFHLDSGRSSSAGMTASVLALQPRRLDLGIDLRRREAGVPKELLNAPQIRATLEQMRCERMAQGVRRGASGDRRLTKPALQAAT